MEQWKQICEASHLLVSNYGRVMNSNTGHILTPRRTKAGYLQIHLPMKNGKRKGAYIHRLVADAFCKHHDGCNVVNHIDNNKTNNNADNLEWATQFQNVHHGMSQKRYRLNAIPVIGYKNGKQFEFVSAHQASKETGCDSSMIIKCCKGKYKKTHGFTWNYSRSVT